METKCPSCGREVHDGASFCPYCAAEISKRIEAKPPRYVPRAALRIILLAVIAAVIALAVYLNTRPQEIDGFGEVFYTDKDGTYQLVLGYSSDRYQPVPTIEMTQTLGTDYRMPMRLFINYSDSGADAGQLFLHKTQRVTAQFINQSETNYPYSCSEPAPNLSYSPDAALLTSVDFGADSGNAELLWTFYMTNGDIIRLRQNWIVHIQEVRSYHPEDYAMETAEELQALIWEIEKNVGTEASVEIFLPPVSYDEPITFSAHQFNLYGSCEGEEQTTFCAPVKFLSRNDSALSYVDGVAFSGGGSGIGIAASATVHFTNCSFTGWKTGVLAYGSVWVNICDSYFENNGVGFHFNSDGGSVTHSLFTNNTFVRNETAILLERVPTEYTMGFGGCLFSDNVKDFDNVCNQPIDISEAVFE